MRWDNFRWPLLLLLAGLLSGCRVAGALSYKLLGPPPVDALYNPRPVPMLVLVERYRSGGLLVNESETLARQISRQLEAQNVAPQIDPLRASELRAADPSGYAKLTISQIGSALGASQVLYVNLTEHSISALDGAGLLSGAIGGTVKVVDVATGKLLWPDEQTEGYPVRVEVAPVAGMQDSPEAFGARLTRQMALRVARLFHRWQPEDLSPREE
ncbi:MAG: hypothetical protein NZ561_08980 [Phycisphaerae bacterium]|nr:hypothetical protein [Phycisphaerae bacterium]MDW8263006.1 hypothetical protein [Phycisphaerales bacterium]